MNADGRYLIIGLGSMGKRRIRNLRSCGVRNISGFDLRKDRVNEARKLYGITAFDQMPPLNQFSAVLVATSPAQHEFYLQSSIHSGVPSFVELSLILKPIQKLSEQIKDSAVLLAPSSTFLFHQGIRKIFEWVRSTQWGRVTGWTYHSGQFLRDWHPWEDVKDFFVGQSETSGIRELLSFELHWLWHLFGQPEEIFASKRQSIDIGLAWEDSVACTLTYKDMVGQMLIDVVSRFPTRTLTINLECGQIRWTAEESQPKIFDAKTKEWNKSESDEPGISLSFMEDMYVRELSNFLEACCGENIYPNKLADTISILGIVDKILQ